MAREVRVCVVPMPGILDLRPSDERGTDMPLFHDLAVQLFSFKDANVSWIQETEVGRLDKEGKGRAFTGCIGSLQGNRSDVAFTFPQQDDYGDNVSLWSTYRSDSPVIGSAFRMHGSFYGVPDAAERATHVLDFLNAYSVEHWIATTCLLVVLMLLLTVAGLLVTLRRRRRFRRSKKTERLARKQSRSACVLVTACLVNQHSACGPAASRYSFSSSFLYSLTTCLTFFTGYFLTSMIKTEMVVIDPPATYNTFQDILDADARPMWLSEMDDARFFRDARPGSVERAIWDQALERGIERSILRLKDFGTNALAAVPIMRAVANRSAVGLSNRFVTQLVTWNACTASRAMNLCPWLGALNRRDPTAAEILRTLAASRHAPDWLRRRLSSRYTHTFEMDSLVTPSIPMFHHLLADPRGHVAEIARCAASVIAEPESQVYAVPLRHYSDLLLLSLGAAGVAALLLLGERRASRLS